MEKFVKKLLFGLFFSVWFVFVNSIALIIMGGPRGVFFSLVPLLILLKFRGFLIELNGLNFERLNCSKF